MALVDVISDQVNQECCAEHREVGDVVTIPVSNYKGMVFEERHAKGADISVQPITGTITAIRWRPAILHREGDYARVEVGYGPGHPVESTDYRDPDVDSWAFDFTLDTDDPIPPPRSIENGPDRPGSGAEWVGRLDEGSSR